MSAQPEPALRLFIACELPVAVKAALREIQEALRTGRAAGLRWVQPEGIHLTLKFLGDVPHEKVAGIIRSLTTAVSGLPVLSLRLGQTGTFGDRRGPRVVWVDLEGEIDRLAAVQVAVEAAMVPLGFPAEGRPFSPHLTLARVPDSFAIAERRRLAALVASAPVPPAPPLAIAAVSLMQSIRGHGGAVYRRLGVAPLLRGSG